MNKFEKDLFPPIPESQGRKGLPIDRSPEGFHADREDDAADLKEKEQEVLARENKKFIPIEEVMDPVSENVEEKLLESIDNPLAWMDKMREEEWNEFMNPPENLNEIVSQASRQIPPDVKEIFKRNALPPKLWESMTPQQQNDWKRKIRNEIEELYLTRPKKFIRRKEKRGDI